MPAPGISGAMEHLYLSSPVNRRTLADGQARLGWLVGFGLLVGAVSMMSSMVGAQTTPAPMLLELSNDSSSYAMELDAGDSAFMQVRCRALGAGAGGWYGAVADAWSSPGVHPAMARVVTPFNNLISPFCVPGTTSYAGQVPCRLEDGLDFMSRALLDPVANECSPSAVMTVLDPLYAPQGLPFISQQFGVTPNPSWPMEGNAFNLDAVMQEAVWRRMSGSVSMTQHQFFNSDDWEGMIVRGVYVSIMLIAVRGPELAPGAGVPANSSTPPELVGFPALPPVCGLSNEARITFGGTAQRELQKFWFSPPWMMSMMSVLMVAPGQLATLPAAGHRPGMQVMFKRANGAGATHVIDLNWQNYGRVSFIVPPTAAPGLHSVHRYRFKVTEVAGIPYYSPWNVIAPTHRPLLGVL